MLIQFKTLREKSILLSLNQIKKYIKVTYSVVDKKLKKREFGVFDNIHDNYLKYVISKDKYKLNFD